MQAIQPSSNSSWTFYGSQISALPGPNDGQDAVQASTVNLGFQALLNNDAYLYALAMGLSTEGPPGRQPPALSGNDYGVKRIQWLNLSGSPPSNAFNNLDVCMAGLLNGTGGPVDSLFFWSASQTITPDNLYVINAATGQWISELYGARGTTTAGTITSSGGPANGIAALDGSGKVPVGELPLDNVGLPYSTTLSGAAGIDAQGFLAFQIGVSSTSVAQSAVIKVGASGAPGFLNGWSAGDSSDCFFWKTQDGMVHLAGTLAPGTVDTTAFTLPAGYCPKSQAGTGRIFLGPTSGGAGQVTVHDNGDVEVNSISGSLYLDGINFLAQQ